MKQLLIISILSTLSLSAFAQYPQELQDLIPAGKNAVRLAGRTEDNKKCSVNMSLSSYAFSASVAVLDSKGEVDSRRFGNFQVGFGHDLKSLQVQDEITIATSAHKAEEQYSSDSRSTLKVNKSGDNFKAVQIIEEEKVFFVYKTVVKETCVIK